MLSINLRLKNNNRWTKYLGIVSNLGIFKNLLN